MKQDFSPFTSLVSKFRLAPPPEPEAWQSLVLRPALRAREGNRIFEEPEQRLWYDPAIVPGVESLKKKLRAWLAASSHPNGDDVILSLLGLFAYSVRSKVGMDDQITTWESLLREASVSHFIVLPGSAASATNAQTPLRHAGFELGLLNDSLLKSRCNRAGSDYFERYGAGLKGRLTLQSPVYERRVINWSQILKSERNLSVRSLPYQLVLSYYEAMAAHHINMMWNDFSEKQLLYVGLGYGILNVRQFSKELGAERITVYLGLDGSSDCAGYVVPNQSSRTIAIPPPEEKSAHLQTLRAKYGIDELAGSSLYPLLQSVCRSVGQADTFSCEDRVDEAFLYSVIALEQVFSEKESTTKKISERTALLTHCQLGLDYKAARKRIEVLYDARSKFVHKGVSINPEQALEIEPIVRAVVRSLIHLCRTKEAPSHAEWLAKLDYLIAGFINVGKTPNEQEMLANGILLPDESSAL